MTEKTFTPVNPGQIVPNPHGNQSSRRDENGRYLPTHGAHKTSAYHVHRTMIARCYNPKNKKWSAYGGRGVYVSDRWLKFENFFADMGDRPRGMSLGRIDNDGPYSIENCRWESSKDQSRNTRTNRWIEFDGKRMILQDWADEIWICQASLIERLNRFPISVALGTKGRMRPYEIRKSS